MIGYKSKKQNVSYAEFNAAEIKVFKKINTRRYISKNMSELFIL